jgi:hypothetical protein
LKFDISWKDPRFLGKVTSDFGFVFRSMFWSFMSRGLGVFIYLDLLCLDVAGRGCGLVAAGVLSTRFLIPIAYYRQKPSMKQAPSDIHWGPNFLIVIDYYRQNSLKQNPSDVHWGANFLIGTAYYRQSSL